MTENVNRISKSVPYNRSIVESVTDHMKASIKWDI